MSQLHPRRLIRRKEHHLPSMRAVLEEDHRGRQSSVDLRPSHVFVVRHHPYGRPNETTSYGDDERALEEEEGTLMYGIESSFLIPDWIFDDDNNVTFEQPGPEPELTQAYLEQQRYAPPKEHTLKIAMSKALAFARRIFSRP